MPVGLDEPDKNFAPPLRVPTITAELMPDNMVKGSFKNFPKPMRLTAVNILDSGAIVLICEPEPSKILASAPTWAPSSST